MVESNVIQKIPMKKVIHKEIALAIQKIKSGKATGPSKRNVKMIIANFKIVLTFTQCLNLPKKCLKWSMISSISHDVTHHFCDASKSLRTLSIFLLFFLAQKAF